MLKPFIVMILLWTLFMIENRQLHRGKEPTSYTNFITKMHRRSGIVFLLIVFVHGIGHLQNAAMDSLVTGGIAFILLCIGQITGTVLCKHKTGTKKVTRIVHRMIPVLLVVVVFFHIALR